MSFFSEVKVLIYCPWVQLTEPLPLKNHNLSVYPYLHCLMKMLLKKMTHCIPHTHPGEFSTKNDRLNHSFSFIFPLKSGIHAAWAITVIHLDLVCSVMQKFWFITIECNWQSTLPLTLTFLFTPLSLLLNENITLWHIASPPLPHPHHGEFSTENEWPKLRIN